jgi:hypothetical protein
MKEKNLEAVVQLVQKYYAANGIEDFETDAEIRTCAARWQKEEKLDDVTTLAALTMCGKYEYNLAEGEIKFIRDFFFPTQPDTFI